MNVPYDRPGGRHPSRETGWEQPTARTAGGVLEAGGYRQRETGWERATSKGGANKAKVADRWCTAKLPAGKTLGGW